MRHLAIVLLIGASILAVAPGAAWAQGEIADGDATYAYTGFVPGGGTTDFINDGATDHVFDDWWFYRITGDPTETALPAPTAESYDGDTANLGFLDVDGRGFDALLTIVITDGAEAGEATVRHDLTITNNSGGDLPISVFRYGDFDVDGSLSDDSAVLVTPNRRVGVQETTQADIRALGADAYQADEFPVILDLLEDAAPTDLDNTGLPFGPADYTGALQWRETTLADGDSYTYTVVEALESVSDVLEIAFDGACPGTVRLTVSDATPGGLVGLVASPSLGSDAAPGGPCAGTELGLSGPRFLGGFSADASGTFTVDLDLPMAACDNFVQAIDVETCGVTNVDPLP